MLFSGFQKTRNIFLLFSFALFPATFYYLSPYLAVRGSFEGVVSGSLLVFFLLFVFSLFFGRIFCGWICPAGAAGEMCFRINGKVLSPKRDLIKYVIWIPWFSAVLFGAYYAGGYTQIDPFYMTENGLSATNITSYIVFLLVFLLVTIPALLFGKRAFCHRLCWMAPFMIFGSFLGRILRIPHIQLRSESSRCTGCQTCANNCPMSLDVPKMVQSEKMNHPECILCRTCVDVCPKKAISCRFGK